MSGRDRPPTRMLVELKTRARLRLNAARRDGREAALRDCLNEVAQQAGFVHWEQCRRVLGGLAREGDDMGTFWWAPSCSSLLNQWFADHAAASAALAATEDRVLLPYRRQFVVAGPDYVAELGMDAGDAAWAAAGRDLAAAYGTPAWERLGFARLRAAR